MTKPDQPYAVITGDIINYSNMPLAQRRHLEPLLHECGKLTSRHFAKQLASPLVVFRGDSWQLVITPPSDALRIALYFRALLISTSDQERIDSRLAIGIGSIDFLPGKQSSSGGGKAFVLSGRKLDDIKPGSGMGIAVDISSEDLQSNHDHPMLTGIVHALNTIFILIDTLALDWTAAQAKSVSWALLGLTQNEIAQKYSPPITQQGVAKHLKAAGWSAVKRALEYYENNLLKL